jgi:UDP-2,3-diacylglucosamine pyrophosphatase LpxH
MCKAARGTRVIYVPGNHDELFRDYLGTSFGGIEMHGEIVHQSADGRRFLVIHGDEFDQVVKHSRWLAVLGSEAYDVLLVLNRWFNWFRRKLGFPYWSLSAYLKHKVKNAVSFISSFEQVLTREARRHGYDGVLCGHIHHAEIRDVDGLLYCNSGDWVESLTALVETLDGELRIVRWSEIVSPGAPVAHWAESEPALTLQAADDILVANTAGTRTMENVA